MTATEAVRSTDPITINEFRVATTGDSTNNFIELYNSGNTTVNLSDWSLTEHAAQQPVNSTITIPAGTSLAAHKTYLLGLSASEPRDPAKAGASTISLRSTTGLSVGDKIQIGTGPNAETRTITAITSTGATGPRAPGKIGSGALNLSGDGEYVQLPNAIDRGLHDYSISTWVNPSANMPWTRIFDYCTGTSDFMFMTLSEGGGPLIFSDTNPAGVVQTLFAPGQLPLNTWSHVAVTLSGTTGTLYIDGKAVDTNNDMTTTPADLGVTTQNWIGHSQFVADPFLDAAVDDFNIYSRALSASEIGALAAGQPGAGDVADYKFDEAGGATAIDSSGNGNNATIIGVGTVSTPLWQPLPDGPITIPKGSTNVPVTSTSGFKVGQKIAIGFGKSEDMGTVTAVGTAGNQAYLAAPAAAGATSIEVTSTAGITAGDKINLDIGSRKETVTVASVGTAGANGTDVTLTAPLQFAHSSNLPFSDRGTGISFTPATRFAHSSDQPVQALGASITLDTPLRHGHEVDTAVIDPSATRRRLREHAAPDQWFRGHASPPPRARWCCATPKGWRPGSPQLQEASSTRPAKRLQGASGTGGVTGASAPTPPTGRSTARDPDGANTDNNCADFFVSPTPTPGASNQISARTRGRWSHWVRGDRQHNQYVTHDDTDDVVVTSTPTAASSEQAKEDSTFVETARQQHQRQPELRLLRVRQPTGRVPTPPELRAAPAAERRQHPVRAGLDVLPAGEATTGRARRSSRTTSQAGSCGRSRRDVPRRRRDQHRQPLGHLGRLDRRHQLARPTRTGVNVAAHDQRSQQRPDVAAIGSISGLIRRN